MTGTARRTTRNPTRGTRARAAGTLPSMSETAAFFRENGYVVVRGLFSAGEVEELRHAIDTIIARATGTQFDRNHTWKAAQADGEQNAVVLKGFHDLQYHDAAFTRAVAHPRLVDVLTQVIGPNVQLHHTKMLVKPP